MSASSNNSQIKTLKNNAFSVLFKSGDKANHIYIINKGSVLLLKHDENKVIPFDLVGAKDFIGYENLSQGTEKYTYSAVVVEDVEYLRVEISELLSVMNELPDWISKLTQTITDRMEESMNSLLEHKLSEKFAFRERELSPKTVNECIALVR